jgi:hypothetical protein
MLGVDDAHVQPPLERWYYVVDPRWLTHPIYNFLTRIIEHYIVNTFGYAIVMDDEWAWNQDQIKFWFENFFHNQLIYKLL